MEFKKWLRDEIMRSIKSLTFSKIIHYFNNTVMPWNYISCIKSNKIKIGFYSIYPPFPVGAAVMTKNIVLELLKNKDIELYAIPLKGKINKKLFKGIRYSKLYNPKLDVVIFYSVSKTFKKLINKTIVWHMIHRKFNESAEESEDFEKIKIADCLFVTSNTALTEFKKHGRQDTKLLRLGIDLTKYVASNKENIVLFISRSQYYKGIIPFLEAAEFTLNNNSNIIKFVLHSPLDKNSPYLEDIYDKIISLKDKYPNNFYFEDKWVSEDKLIKLFSKAKILVFPSNNEGFGLPLIEAMASGCVCITSDRFPMNELIINTVTGFCLPLTKRYHEFLFPDPEAIKDKIELLIKNDALFSKLSANSIKESKKYDIKKIANVLIKKAEDLMTEKK